MLKGRRTSIKVKYYNLHSIFHRKEENSKHHPKFKKRFKACRKNVQTGYCQYN